jgi:hypothetical protein
MNFWPVQDLSLPISNVEAFLVQGLDAHGDPPTDLSQIVKGLSSTDTLTWRKQDIGNYSASDAFVAPNWCGTTWSGTPFGSFNVGNGDGGEVYRFENGSIYAAATQDGGTPGIQYFVGAYYGGDSWLLFDVNPPAGTWAGRIARLAEAASPFDQPPLGEAYTRWRREVLTIPFNFFGTVVPLTLPCIIHQHFNGADIASASDMEMAVFAQGYGRIFWAGCGPGPMPDDLIARLPSVPWPVPPERPDWAFTDGRTWINLCRIATGQSNKIEWPPADFAL